MDSTDSTPPPTPKTKKTNFTEGFGTKPFVVHHKVGHFGGLDPGPSPLLFATKPPFSFQSKFHLGCKGSRAIK